MQEIRRFRPSAVSRRFSVTAGFCRTCVLDSVLEHSPAGHVRLPRVPAGSPALGFTHLQSGALLTAARAWARSTATGSLGVCGKGHQGGPGPAAVSRRPGHRPGGPASGTAGRSC
jgi:hypothetical protein